MFFPSAVVATRATPIVLRSGEERSDVDIQLQPVRTVEVSGTLMDSSGPVPHFGVHLMPADAGDGASVLEVATTSTDARGAFVFPLVPSGSYTLLALRTDPASGGGSSPPAAPRTVSEAPGAWATQPLAVGDANVGNVLLTLRGGVHITGRVEFSGASERPAATRLRQLVPLTVSRAQPLFRQSAGAAEVPLTPTGGFSTSALSPGRYILGLQIREAAPTWTLQSVTAGGRDVTDAVMTIGGTDVNDVVVVLTDQPAELTGTVSDAKGPADLDASVFVFPVDQCTVAGRSDQHARVPDRSRLEDWSLHGAQRDSRRIFRRRGVRRIHGRLAGRAADRTAGATREQRPRRAESEADA